MFVLSLIIMLFILNIKVFNNKIFNYVLIISCIMLPIIVVAKQKFELKIKFDAIIVNGKYETSDINFDFDNGKNEITEETYGHVLEKLPENPLKVGYKFVKWVDDDNNVVDENTIITKKINVKAVYDIVNYNISYDLDGGLVNNKIMYNIESESFTLNNPVKDGYIFTGWTGSNGDTKETDITINKYNE